MSVDEPTWLPMGSAQRAVWLDLRLGADPLAYLVGGRARIDGEVDLDALRQALRLLVARHDVLRLRIDTDEPRQRLAEPGPLPLTVHDLPADALDVDAAVESIVRRCLAQPLPMGGDRPLFAVDLVRAGPRRMELLWRFNHLIADSAAVAITIRRWAETYEVLSGDVAADLPPGSRFTATLAADEAYARSKQAEADLAHWRRRYAELPAPLLARRAAPAPASAPRHWTLEGTDHAAWRAACAQAGVTEQRALVALLALAIGIRHDRRDVSIGLALHRRDPATREVIGMFAAAVPLRCQWAADDTLASAVRRIAEQLEQDFRHQRAPMDAIGRALNLGARGHGRLFDVSLSHTVVEPATAAAARGRARFTPQSLVPSPIVPLPFLVMDHAGAQRLEFLLASDPAWVSEAEAASVCGLLQRVVAQFGRQAAWPLAELEPVSDTERAVLLDGFNPPAMDYPANAMLHELVRAQARRTPDAVAVVDGALTLSYAEVDARSEALARRIAHALQNGAQDEPVVGVALPRSADTVVALLAILKAGAVYLPLDIAYPVQRLQYMLDDAKVALLIGEVDGLECRTLTGSQTSELPVHADPERLAYVIYTSGSTGEPKAVGVPHRAAVNLAYARQGHDPIGEGDRVLAAISVGFDVSIGQLLLPLLSGAAIVIAPPLKQLQADEFWALLARHRVSHINSVPSFFETVSEALVAQPEAQRYRGLKRLMLGGEALTGALASKLQQRLPGTQIVNMYGPTETCIDATAYPVPEGELPASLPIGRPLPNYRAYVLDALGRLAPVGVTGELCIAGAGLARGYLGRPGATAEKFVADPHGAPGSRLYRSGDLARWREDGQLEFLGRNDQQVKIRGFRVETGEIEAVLLQHPALRQAAVLASKDATGTTRLVAYLVLAPGQVAPEADALRAWLARRLPEHMVPPALLWLPALPLNTNGKLDRKALPLPDAGAFARQAYAAPQGELETLIATLWQDLLALPRVGRDDSFFDLGGHSLLAIAFTDRLQRAGWQLAVTALFEQPTLQALARQAVPVGKAPSAAPPGIPDGCRQITPELLPMVALTQPQIDRVVARVPGGAAQVQDLLPLGPLQQGMLFHHLIQRDGDVYYSPIVLGLATREALDGFVAALQRVIARHDILRSSFDWEGLDAPVQVVWRQAPMALQWLEPPATSDALAALLAEVDPLHHRLDLRHAPLLRALAMPDPAHGRWLLALGLHHLSLDHASVGRLLHEVAALQRGLALPPPVPLRDLVWQARQGLGEAEHEAFFREQLGEVEAPTAPFGLATLEFDTGAMRDARLALPAPLAQSARDAARHAGVSLASLMHLAWALVLARCSGRDDVVFGTVLLGRMHAGPGAAQALGMLINTLPLRLEVGTADVRSALQATQQRLAQLMRHEQAPLALAQRCSGVPAPAPLFTALFNFRQTPAASALPEGIELLWGQERTGYPLALAVDDDGQGLSLAVQALAPANAQRVARLMQAAVRAIVEQPQAACASLELLGPEERAALLDGFNPAPMAYPAQAMLHELVQAQARRTPDAVAVVDGELTLSYAEVDARSEALARRIAHALRDGAQPEPVVGVALPRSADTVVALLAILKAGAVYLPLDIAYPVQRLQYMLDDAKAALLIGEVDGLECRTLTGSQTSELPVHNDPERLAYVIYTSGSTGEPKAVGVPHRAAVNLAYARQGHDPIGEGDRVLAAISVGFDVSIGQLLLPLLSGAAIVIAPPLKQLQADEFWALLARHRVSHINSVPSFFETVSEALVAQPEAQRYRGLKRLMLGGEALTGALASKLQQRLPGTQIVNMYGPTETCIDATAYPVPEGELPASLPIGRPLPNYRAYVLDALGRLAPVGVTGELCIAGAGLARGYLGRDEATAQKFVPDPFAPGERMYRSGDLARWREDGQLEFLGRNDQQVKIRGFRVETGEIEAVLLQHPKVVQAAVIARRDGTGQMRLLGYTVGDDALTTDELRTWLATRLPEHMVPPALLRLPALPLTPNGKLDRAALPVPAADAFAARSDDPPQGDIETLIAGLWQDLLGVPRVQRDDDFFDLGGQSLRAIALVERLRQAGWALDVPTLFAQPTLRALAAACRPLQAGVAVPPPGIPVGATQITPAMLPMLTLSQVEIDAAVATVPGGAAAVQDLYPLAPLQEGMLFHHLLQAEGDVFLTPFVIGFAQREALDGFVDALNRVIARHDVLRTSLAWAGLPQPVQLVWREAVLPLEEVAAPAEGDVLPALIAAVDPAHHRIDLRRAPLLRAVAMPDAAGGRWLLGLCLHHLVLDHTSMDIVLREVAALRAGQGARLAAPVPFRNLLWQARQGLGEAEHEAFFREQLGEVEAPTAPFGLSTLEFDTGAMGDARLALPVSLAQSARDAARHAGVSLASLMHLAWALVLARCSGRDDVVFGTVLLGRMNAGPGAAQALGMLINTLPLRLDVGTADVRSAMQATQQRLAQLMRHEQAPLALAQRCSGVPAPAPAPLFTALFNFRQTPAASALPEGIELLWGQERTGYPLALAVDDDGQGLSLAVQALAPADAQRVARLMQAAVRAIVEQPQAACASLELLGPEERAALLDGFNPPAMDYPAQAMLQDLVRAQARRTPEAVAVVDGELTLSYAEVDARSEALAHRIAYALRDGAQDEPVVGVALPRSADTVVALLAILKAGAVYLPLDIAYPVQRLQYMLDDAKAALLIGEVEGLQGRSLTDVQTSELPVHADPERLAYVIYTSGSTGEPKAVGVPHRAAVNLAYARQGHDPIGEGDRVLAAISVGFDVSIGQLLLPLLSGAAIVIAPPLKHLQADEFWALLARHRVSHINSVPSFFETVSEALVAQPEAQRYRGLKRLMLGGEALTGALASKLQQRLPGTQIVNMYGPTETCIDATAYPVPDGELAASLPIGKPLPNYRAYVLDALGRLAPVGVTGELCIAGAGLARGYLGRDEATAQKFVADPFAPGERMYRSGDLARWREDGQLEFLGRNDQQVKIRGFRVETGEIEAVLLQHPQVAQAAVIARRDGTGQMRLLGYTVGNDALPTDELRAWLAARLPEHMVPPALLRLPALPLTPNGKLDRAALPVPDASLDRERRHVPPRDALEAALQAAWQATFGLAPIGIDDDFFALGGHSLLALRLINACVAAARAQGVADAAQRLRLRDLLAQPSIAAMVAALRGPVASTRPPWLVPLRAGGDRPPLFCVHPQSGTVWCYADLVRALDARVPVWGLQAPGLAAGEQPLPTVEASAEAYLAAVRELQPTGPYQLLGYSSGGVVAQAMARRLQAAGETVSLLALLDSPLPDGTDPREAGLDEVLADVALLLGITDPAQAPRDAAQLQALLVARGLAEPGAGVDEAQRQLETARQILQATRRHVPQPADLPLLQVRALRRDTPPADWGATLTTGRAETHDLDTDHLGLVGADCAPLLAALLHPRLR